MQITIKPERILEPRLETGKAGEMGLTLLVVQIVAFLDKSVPFLFLLVLFGRTILAACVLKTWIPSIEQSYYPPSI